MLNDRLPINALKDHLTIRIPETPGRHTSINAATPAFLVDVAYERRDSLRAGRDIRPRPSLASRVLDLRPMPHELSRRCVVWVSPAVLHAASELAELVGLDVDSFVAMLVLELHEQQLSDSRMQAGGVAASGQRSNGRVIPLGLRGKQRGRSQARMR